MRPVNAAADEEPLLERQVTAAIAALRRSGQLSARSATIVALAVLGGWPDAAIAAEVGQSVAAVKKARQRALVPLRLHAGAAGLLDVA